MQAVMNLGRTAVALPGTLAKACPSSWVSWVCYWVAFGFASRGEIGQELVANGTGPYIVAGGLALFFAAVVAIQRQMRLSLRANSYGMPQKLVTSGVFRYSRNPIYAAFLMPLLSLGYFSPVAALAAVAVYILAMNLLVIRSEEQILEERFGAEYLAYKRSVPRWVF